MNARRRKKATRLRTALLVPPHPTLIRWRQAADEALYYAPDGELSALRVASLGLVDTVASAQDFAVALARVGQVARDFVAAVS